MCFSTRDVTAQSTEPKGMSGYHVYLQITVEPVLKTTCVKRPPFQTSPPPQPKPDFFTVIHSVKSVKRPPVLRGHIFFRSHERSHKTDLTVLEFCHPSCISYISCSLLTFTCFMCTICSCRGTTVSIIMWCWSSFIMEFSFLHMSPFIFEHMKNASMSVP